MLVKCLKMYFDLDLNELKAKDDKYSVKEERAKYLSELGYVEIIEEEKPKRSRKKKEV